jgi:hypothetical protein
MNFQSIQSIESVSLFSSDWAWVEDNATGFSVSGSDFPSDWGKAIRRADIKNEVKFAVEMTGKEMAAHLSEIYGKYSDAAHDAKTANAVADNRRFASQDETKEDWA